MQEEIMFCEEEIGQEHTHEIFEEKKKMRLEREKLLIFTTSEPMTSKTKIIMAQIQKSSTYPCKKK
jgi:hypothetical protein